MSKKPLSQKVFEETAENKPNFQEWQKIQMQLITTEEELLPELKKAIVGESIRHPLLVAHATPNALNNYLFLSKKRDIEQAEKECDWAKYVFGIERPYRVDAFREVQSKMDDKTYWEILSAVYTDSENLRQSQGAIRRLLTADRKHREAMMTDEEQVIFNALPESVTIYRGYGFTNSHGWSWTLDKEKAEWFAERFKSRNGSVPRVATGKINKKDIIAYFDGREEKEIVCDPKLINDIHTERLDGKQDKPRVPIENKYENDFLSQLLQMHMKQNPTLLLSELSAYLEFMNEEVESLIDQFGEEKLCSEIDIDSIDCELLKSELKESGNSEIGELPEYISEALDELDELTEDYDGALCGDFEL